MSLLLLAAALLGGTALALQDDGETPWYQRVAEGAVVGVSLLGLVGYLLASALGLGSTSLVLAGFVTLLPALAVPRQRWARLLPTMPRPAAAVYAVLVCAGLALVFDRACFETDAGIFTGLDNNLGDLPFHISLIEGFVSGENLPPQHPELSGTRLTYPFLADFGVAQLVAAGMARSHALLVQNLILAFALFGLLHGWALRVSGDRLAASVAPLLLFLSGGFGFLEFFDECRTGSPLSLLRRLPHDYTLSSSGPLRFGNPLICLLTTQRSLLLGAPLVLIALDKLWRATDASLAPASRRRLLLHAGVVAGLLPLAHAHALALLLGAAACHALLFPPLRPWLAFFLAALAMAVPQVGWLASGSSLQTSRFLEWQPGWDNGSLSPALFWLYNAGLFIPLLLVGCWRVAPPRLVRFHLPFWGVFLLANLFRLSPWIWDNIKFLFFWLLASTPIVALVVARLRDRGLPGALAAGALFITLTLSGTLDVFRVASRQISHRVFDAEGAAFAREIKDATSPRALLLRAPSYDSPVLLAGRRSVLGYPGHIWSQGLDGGTRQEDIARIYAGGDDAAELLRRYGVDYVLVGPQERSAFPVSRGFFSQFPVVAERGGFVLRRVH